jgi:hypothetical protein
MREATDTSESSSEFYARQGYSVRALWSPASRTLVGVPRFGVIEGA